MRKTMIVLVAVLVAGRAFAAEYGVGVSAKSDNTLLYFPIDVSPKLRIEPHLRHMTSESKQETELGGSPSVFRSESDSWEVGIGLFGLAEPKESVRFYYGARLGYFDGDSRSSSISVDNRQSYYGYQVTPTVGFEYLFNRHFTLGGEVGYFYEKHNIQTSSAVVDSDTDFDRSGTESFLILRYFF